jgi:enoyl-CoA hydratase/carnithine racemase
VNDAAPVDELDALIDRFAAKFTDKSPEVAWHTKQAVNQGLDGDYETLAALERITADAVAATADAREGVASFLARQRE